MAIKLSSTAFEDGGMIPQKFTGRGDDMSPPLQWSGIPGGAKSLAITCNDPDAPGGNFVHWLLYSLPAHITTLPENLPAKEILDNGAKQGITDFGSTGYGGPNPPSGVHRYIFKIFALDTILNLPAGASEQQLQKAIKGHILDEGRLTGKYGK